MRIRDLRIWITSRKEIGSAGGSIFRSLSIGGYFLNSFIGNDLRSMDEAVLHVVTGSRLGGNRRTKSGRRIAQPAKCA